jgi:glycosyltransferase involved in cell wall biosynthesis
MNVAFTDSSLEDTSWTAGAIYLATLVEAVRRACSSVGVYTLSMWDPERAQQRADALHADGTIWHEPPRRWKRDWALAWAARQFGRASLPLEWTLRRAGIDVVFSFPLAHDFGAVPTIGWLADFQHRHLPQLFSAAERRARDAMLRDTIRVTDLLLVMTDAVRHDVQEFAPEDAHRTRVLHPVAWVPEHIYEQDPLCVVRRYHLPEKFVYVPNQFWAHKNHETLFRAVKLLTERGIDLRVVCSGNSSDHRNPEHFARLAAMLSLWSLRDRVTYLGLVERDDALLLMRQAVCVVNPSSFEGWGYAAEEARSVGKQVLLSDIAAHREQNPPRATFFQPSDVVELADKMAQIWRDSRPGPDRDLEAAARRTADDRLRAYGAGFLAIASEVLNGRISKVA